MAYQIAATAVT